MGNKKARCYPGLDYKVYTVDTIIRPGNMEMRPLQRQMILMCKIDSCTLRLLVNKKPGLCGTGFVVKYVYLNTYATAIRDNAATATTDTIICVNVLFMLICYNCKAFISENKTD